MLNAAASTFVSNVASFQGGAIYCRNAVVGVCSFQFNVGAFKGGAIYSATLTTPGLTVGNSTFLNNYTTIAGGAGGAICADPSPLVITGGSFTNNQAPHGSGGAVAFVNGLSMALTNITFKTNTAASGGAVSSVLTAVIPVVTETVSGCLFYGNTATTAGATTPTGGAGGALYTDHDGTAVLSLSVTVVNSTFYENASDNYGGAIALDNVLGGTGSSSVSLTSLTVYQNEAGTSGGGLWIGPQASAPKVNNSIIAVNHAQVDSNGPDVFGTVNSQGYNLIGIKTGSAGWHGSMDPKPDLTGTSAVPLNPGLDPNGLQDNGGPTLTIKLLTTSQAYHSGDPLLAGFPDQRGKIRQMKPEQNLEVSIGAYDPDAIDPGGN